ncbi:hypothetical protein HG537_0H01760 [Torulaspora globosa]|uniref:non-specific serine/threonine protein kinase n=1 Tax=Torulaspora globosa TaxID=48254 RepID=A0A7H9HXG1_9SACH|nr:hypothetical protein HG537_0H01760 [Torulaspora sp. CBS 2947]
MPNTNDYHVNTQFKMGGGNSLTPSTVAPATARMMGSKGQSQQNSLNPALDVTESANESKSHKNGRSHAMEPKQFHRKSLGEWDFLETIGAGSMGKVKLAKHRYTGEICAIKIVNRATNAFLHKEQSLPPPKKEEEILERQKKLEKEISRDKRTIREASLGQILYHPHICRLFEMCTMSNHFYMLFEYVSGGQLLDYIIQHGSLKEHHARKFTRGIASALQYLHANNIVHRDLKIENIMISTSGEIKIIDFGLSNLFDRRKQLHTFCGSLYFAAPELLKACPYTGPEVDIWSFGVVLYVLVCGKVPFDDENSSVLHEKIKQGKVEYPQHLSIEVISLLSKMLVVDPKRRATLKQVVEHHWMIRGYDCPPPSYVPNRIPLTPEMLDINVVKEMFRLEFIDDIDETMRFLNLIVTEDSYVQLSKQYWSSLTNLNVRSISSDLNGSESQIVQSNIPGASGQHERINKGETFEDPTRAYHPLLSIYYLVDEMLRRKLAKLQRKQQAAVLQQQRQQELQQQSQKQEISRLGNPLAVEHSQGTAMVPAGAIDSAAPSLQEGGASISAPLAPPVMTTKSGKQRPLQVLVPPKLAIPEQAHTSPTTKKGFEGTKEQELVLSPIPQVNDYQQRSASPTSIDQGEKPKFGNIFRRLSQRRAQHQSEQQATTVNQSPRIQNQTPPQIQISGTNGKRIPKTHSRAISECTPASLKSVALPGGPTPAAVPRNGGTTILRSASQKQNADLPALPVNAESMVQQQLQKLVEKDLGKLNVAEVTEPGNSNMDNMLSQDESKPLPPLNVTKGRKLHPSARAKSVGHARRESLKFMRPPVPATVSPKDYEDSGFLDDNETTKNYNERGDTIGNGDSTAGRSTGTNAGYRNADGYTDVNTGDDELTDEQVLEEASKAPPGSMPSIDYPRSLFLKGFFSVQTTSSKPLPIVRYKIIQVLKKMHIDFNEVKGGFVCVLKLSNPVTQSMVESAPPAQQQFLQPTVPAESVQRRSGSRHGSMRRQGSVKYTQAAAPSTPGSGTTAATHERNISLTLSPPANSLSGDLSSPSFESMHQDDILTTSRAQEMNNVESSHEEAAHNKEKPPIKFEIHIVKVRIVGLAGVHFKKVSGNTWIYKEIASDILKQLNL